MQVEFDEYAAQYAELLRDPIRERFAPGSAFFVERKWSLLAEICRRHGIEPSKSSWLDVGCGQGDLLRLGRSHWREVVGCDPSAAMIRSCGDVDVHLQPGPTEIPFTDRSMDLVTAVCVYHHVDVRQRDVLTSEIWRVLKPGGAFCMIEHNPLNPVTRLIVGRTPVDAEAELLTAREAARLMRAAAFKVLKSQYFMYLPERAYRTCGFVEGYLGRVPFGGQYAQLGLKG